MAALPFTYPASLFDECVGSNLVRSLVTRGTTVTVASGSSSAVANNVKLEGNGVDLSCFKLFGLFNEHYGKPHRNYKEAGGFFERSRLVQDALEDVIHYHNIEPRFERFLQSVAFVHAHNSNNVDTSSSSSSSHRVSLNRFSDMDAQNLFSDADTIDGTFDAMRRRAMEEEAMEEVLDFETIGHGGKYLLNPDPKHPKAQQIPVKEIRVPDRERLPFGTPVIGTELDGYLLTVRKRKIHKGASPSDADEDDEKDDDDITGDAVVSPDNYKRFLNWATTDNPDGVAIVHDAFDQLSCGSCWAFAASGSLEASASRRTAYIAYETFRTSHRDMKHVNQTIQEVAIEIAQTVQRRSMNVLNLSVQELLDCDSITDQGCVGGNPLLAFFYINQNGLLSWDDYPYKAKEDSCQRNDTQKPVATVKSWGILQSDHEKHMKMALRYVGPIAVGINGDTPEFLAYRHGIFDSPKCKQKANHALLIVGYGEETDFDGNVVKYWIARNSWGTGWGENGYIRIKRGKGHAGVPGVCGIARNPSVALGGVLLRETSYVFNVSGLGYQERLDREGRLCKGFGTDSEAERECSRISMWTGTHRALALGLISVFCGLVLIWPLTLDIRRRRKRRKLQKLKQEEMRKRMSNQNLLNEETPLLSSAENETATQI